MNQEIDIVEKLFEVQGLEQKTILNPMWDFIEMHDRIWEEVRDSIASTLAQRGGDL